MKSFVQVAALCLAVMFLSAPASVRAQPAHSATEATEVWLVTYGPGEIYWQRFGHNAIWIRDARLGLDHVFNFGFFDFDQESFLLRFLQGRMLYFSAAQPVQQEFDQYISENRSIRAQRLSLTPQQKEGLTQYLVNEVQPDNRDYLYDYYRNNCSTRIRDALDMALSGMLEQQFAQKSAVQNWRDHTRRLTVSDYWLYLGLELGLGSPVDAPVSRWDEFFIPAILADAVAGLPVHPAQSAPLVVEDVMLFESTLPEPAAMAGQWWPRYLLLSVILLLATFIANRLFGWLDPLLLARVWLVFAGLIGVVLVYLWCCTDHLVARNNLNVALFNPLWLLCLTKGRWRRFTGGLVMGLASLALVQPFWPGLQYTADLLAGFCLLNLTAGWILLGPAKKP